MEISNSQFKHCDLITVVGRIDSATAPQFAEVFNSIMNEGRYKIVLDMEKIDFISSAGLRVLINSQKTCKRYNRGEVVLTNVPPNIFSALDLAGFTRLFKIFPDVLTAVGNF
ncbi:MAG: STAS domain-containing protein [Anaerolineae bacterium]|nr:STAS domain-containing protein [Anaerolineae bacterium]